MIYCKDCKKYAKLKGAFVNGLDDVKLAGSCKHCGYDEPVPTKDTKWSDIPESKVDYEDWDELGIDR